MEDLKIHNFRGVYSRDNLPKKILEDECGIINLDVESGPGTHWVCYRNYSDTTVEYFDSFGLPMAEEILTYLRTSKKKIYYNTDEIQERNSVLCGYWCLYYLRERQKGTTLLDTIHNPKFSPTNHIVNHNFLIKYFKQI